VQKISVVVPVYNEHENIGACLRRLSATLAGIPHEILVCYDFDEDTTLAAIAALPDAPAALRLVRNRLGRGAACALRAGFEAAEGDVVVASMADLSDSTGSIPRMAELMRARGLAVVSGSRYMRGGSQSGGPLLKRTLSRIAGVSLDWIAGVGTRNATTNFRAYSRSFLRSVAIESRAGFEIALELTVKAHLLGLGVGEVPASWTDRSAGASRFRLWRWMPNYLRWWLRAAWQPLLVWTSLALGMSCSLENALLGLAGLCALLATRALRGRLLLVDMLQALLWTHPWHAQLFDQGRLALDLGATLLASAGLLLASRRLGRGTPAR